MYCLRVDHLIWLTRLALLVLGRQKIQETLHQAPITLLQHIVMRFKSTHAKRITLLCFFLLLDDSGFRRLVILKALEAVLQHHRVAGMLRYWMAMLATIDVLYGDMLHQIVVWRPKDLPVNARDLHGCHCCSLMHVEHIAVTPLSHGRTVSWRVILQNLLRMGAYLRTNACANMLSHLFPILAV